ncbi:transcriptional regulator [Kaarinaea lacus]
MSYLNLGPLNSILHQPVRTQLVAFLMTRENATFKELKEVLEVTDGNLDAHIKKLIAEKYLTSKKVTGKGRPQTYYSLTGKGTKAFREYIQTLQVLLHSEDYKQSKQ